MRSLGFGVVRLRLHGEHSAAGGGGRKAGGRCGAAGKCHGSAAGTGISLYYIGYGGLPIRKYGLMVRKHLYFSGQVQEWGSVTVRRGSRSP